jgi:ornithine cyclodeaminase
MNHQSTALLFDLDTGVPDALIRATHLTALRTAAASAISIRHLARKDAKYLGILGAGGQAEFQVRAALAERSFVALLSISRIKALFPESKFT